MKLSGRWSKKGGGNEVGHSNRCNGGGGGMAWGIRKTKTNKIAKTSLECHSMWAQKRERAVETKILSPRRKGKENK